MIGWWLDGSCKGGAHAFLMCEAGGGRWERMDGLDVVAVLKLAVAVHGANGDGTLRVQLRITDPSVVGATLNIVN